MDKFDINDAMREDKNEVSWCFACENPIVDGQCKCKKEVLNLPNTQQANSKRTVPQKQQTSKDINMKQEVNTEVKQEEQALSPYDLIQNLDGAPSQEQIDAWKTQWGQIYSMFFGPKRPYIFRTINRREWQNLQSNEGLLKDPSKLQEYVVLRAVLFPKFTAETVNSCRAGLIPTLFEMIMKASDFLPVEEAILLVSEL